MLDSVSGNRLAPLYKQLLRFIDWNDENLLDIINFIDHLPWRSYVYLSNSLGLLFEIDYEIYPEDFENLNFDSLTPVGHINNVLGFRKKFIETKKTYEVFNMTMEALGVYIKAQKPSEFPEEDSNDAESKERAWVPLAQMINPTGYEGIQKSLVYKETEKIGEQSESKKTDKQEKLEENSKINKSNERISLSTLSREEFVKMIYNNANIGFLKAASKGISQKSYMSALERGIDPLVRDDRTKLIKEQANLVENTPITIKSRWKGAK